MPEPLTQMERRVYQYLIDFLAENTYQPSIREIAKKFRIKSTKTVSDLLHALESKGYIRRDESRSRGVHIFGFAAAGETQPVPVMSVSARVGAPSSVHAQRYVTMDRRFLPSDDVLFLRASDDAMSGRGILTDDYVMVSPSARAKDGDLVAARVGGVATVRTLTHRGATIVLESTTSAVRPIEVGPTDDFAIVGVVCGVFRPYTEREPSEPTTESQG
ncbi:MAG TPA: transcriptional repressor LexA [Gemmatimonadaceae bacterium]